MTLPPLDTWPDTAAGLHQAAQILGAIRLLVREPVANYLELALQVERAGLSTGPLPGGGQVLLAFDEAAVHCRDANGAAQAIPLSAHSQASLLEEILATLDGQGQGLVPEGLVPDVTGGRGGLGEGFVAALAAKGHSLAGSLQVTAKTPLVVDAETSAEYGRALYRIFTALARWRARLTGPQTPVVVWPEHFDLSTLWFAGEGATEASPHMNFGFAPFDGNHARPYLYAYAHPMPAGFDALPLPRPARWNTAPWQGMIVPYDDLAVLDDPEAEIERLYEIVHALLSPAARPTAAA